MAKAPDFVYISNTLASTRAFGGLVYRVRVNKRTYNCEDFEFHGPLVILYDVTHQTIPYRALAMRVNSEPDSSPDVYIEEVEGPEE